MNTEPKHLKFVEAEPLQKTRRVLVFNKHDNTELGGIRWFGRWRCYEFIPATGTGYEHVCLRDIANYIEAMTKEHKQAASDRMAAART